MIYSIQNKLLEKAEFSQRRYSFKAIKLTAIDAYATDSHEYTLVQSAIQPCIPHQIKSYQETVNTEPFVNAKVEFDSCTKEMILYNYE